MSRQVKSKIFKVQHDWSGWTVTLRINQDSSTLDTMREMLLFWMGGQDRIDDCEGDVQTAWLLFFAQRAIVESVQWNLQGVKSQFEQREGWAPLDGSCGIELIACDSLDFETDDFSVTESQEA